MSEWVSERRRRNSDREKQGEIYVCEMTYDSSYIGLTRNDRENQKNIQSSELPRFNIKTNVGVKHKGLNIYLYRYPKRSSVAVHVEQ